MRWFKIMRQQKLLSLSLLLVTLSIGIVIGTLINTGVHAARGQSIAPDASPLVVPNPVQLGNEFTKLAKKLEPSVVYITADYTQKVAAENPHKRGEQQRAPATRSDDGMDLFRHFFRNGPYRRSSPARLPAGAIRHRIHRRQERLHHHQQSRDRQSGPHQSEAAQRRHHRISRPRGRHRSGNRSGGDQDRSARSPLVPVTIGNSDAVQVGDWAVAIGSPFGLEASVTAGIVSALGRDIGGALQLQRFIQTDAAINPGNSGGPLLNIRGEVIGVNTMIATQSGGYQGIGFALPINMVARVYNDIIRTGRVTRGSIGVQWQKADNKPELFRALGTNQGVLVERGQEGRPGRQGRHQGGRHHHRHERQAGEGRRRSGGARRRHADRNAGDSHRRSRRQEHGLQGHHHGSRRGLQRRSAICRSAARIPKIRPRPDATAQYKFGMKLHALTDAERTAMGLEGQRRPGGSQRRFRFVRRGHRAV